MLYCYQRLACSQEPRGLQHTVMWPCSFMSQIMITCCSKAWFRALALLLVPQSAAHPLSAHAENPQILPGYAALLQQAASGLQQGHWQEQAALQAQFTQQLPVPQPESGLGQGQGHDRPFSTGSAAFPAAMPFPRWPGCCCLLGLMAVSTGRVVYAGLSQVSTPDPCLAGAREAAGAACRRHATQ